MNHNSSVFLRDARADTRVLPPPACSPPHIPGMTSGHPSSPVNVHVSLSATTPRWSRGDSNPGPPPCKGGALPTKLRPPPTATETAVTCSSLAPGWARLDSNQGPRPYQGRALTS
jgi:hypothetical protein